MVNRWTEAYTTVSGGLEMKISNDSWLTGPSWQPYAARKAWTLGESSSEVHTVYAQFRDSAGNESFVIRDDIMMIPPIHVPVIVTP